MTEITNQRFDELITQAMDELPQEYIAGLKNVVVTQADEPTEAQKEKMKLRDGHILLGLFEGVPLTQQGNGWSGMLPSKITLFKNSIIRITRSEADFFEQIKRTLWHEIAHFYGVSHQRMDELQRPKGN